MNIYSKKQRWKFLLFSIAFIIVGFSLWYTDTLVSKIALDERQKIKLWGDAIRKKAKLVVYTNELFEKITAEEHKIFAYYLEVRNMFMHNFKAITYVSCYELLPESTRNGIRKMYYPDKAKRGKEQQLTPVECKSALKKLGKEALALTGKLIKQPSNHYSLKAKELRDKFENAIMTTINEITTRLDIYFNTAIEKGDNLNPKIFENFGTKLNKQIIKDISIKMGWNRKPIQRPIQP